MWNSEIHNCTCSRMGRVITQARHLRNLRIATVQTSIIIGISKALLTQWCRKLRRHFTRLHFTLKCFRELDRVVCFWKPRFQRIQRLEMVFTSLAWMSFWNKCLPTIRFLLSRWFDFRGEVPSLYVRREDVVCVKRMVFYPRRMGRKTAVTSCLWFCFLYSRRRCWSMKTMLWISGSLTVPLILIGCLTSWMSSPGHCPSSAKRVSNFWGESKQVALPLAIFQDSSSPKDRQRRPIVKFRDLGREFWRLLLYFPGSCFDGETLARADGAWQFHIIDKNHTKNL